MMISDFARQLLQGHAERPNDLFYGVDVLGSFFRDVDLERLDSAYKELANAGLLDSSGAVVTFFGSPKSLYRLTDSGAKEAARENAA